ncbi:hypothetical protein [Hydrogenophaga sp. 2FB]|uniref:hypothetical protein n=1 Tax=Hydrogenophaga sp. 2FB TaxID=2502187 RepID=UPI0010F48530|nr:hypothetical protein [Hydrogenophaga sp. 2FB]
MGAFAFGDAQGLATPQAHGHGQVADAATTPEKTANTSAALADHGLSDMQSDVPECLSVVIATAAQGASWHLPSPPLAQDLTPPVLDGPQRPPRGPLPALA